MNQTLEQRIDYVIDSMNEETYNSWIPIVEWNGNRNFNSEAKYSNLTLKRIDELIQNATLAECLTSPSEYIREYRKWYEASKA